MEDVLSQYALPYDPLRPLMCFDERPCFLIGDVGSIIPMSPGKAKRYHYEYEHDAALMQILLAKHYPQVECIRLVQDNLHTQTPGAFYEVLPPGDAFALSQRFEPHYTPLKGSWLNRAEIEFAALAKQCLDRRIPTLDFLDRAVLVWADTRNRDRKTVHWRFSQNDARDKFHRHYRNVQKFM
jgi:hypothetical protein